MTWDERVTRAEQADPKAFTAEDKRAVWSCTSCAAGEKLGLSEMQSHDANRIYTRFDYSHNYVGLSFSRSVHNDDVPTARRLLTEIQAIPMETSHGD